MLGTFGKLWLVFSVAGVLGALGWPRSVLVGGSGLALGMLATAAILDDGFDDLGPVGCWHATSALVLFFALQGLGLWRRRKLRRRETLRR
jgi:hypothetical protein